MPKRYREYQEKSLKVGFPFGITIVNYKCNLNCKYCFLKYVNKSFDIPKLTLDDYDSLFEQLIEQGVILIQFTGGEPLLIDNFQDIVEIARSKGFKLNLATNATLLKEKDIPFIKKMFDEIQISLDSLKEEENDYLWGVQGYHKHVLNMIDILHAEKVKLRINTVVTKHNVLGAADLHNYIKKKYGIHHGMAFSLIPFINKPQKISEFQIGKEEFDMFKYRVSENVKESRLNARKSKWTCGMTMNSLSIDTYGQIFPCMIGVAKLEHNIRETLYKDIFYSREVERIRSKIKSVEYVQGCPMYNYIAKGKLF